MTGGGHQGGHPDEREARPLYWAADPKSYAPTEKDGLSLTEKLQMRNFQLWKVTSAIDRRDTVMQMYIQNETSTGGSHKSMLLGTPFPIVEPSPSINEAMTAIRWYEHMTAVVIPLCYNYWLKSKPRTRRSFTNRTHLFMTMGNIFLLDFGMIHRSTSRLTGHSPNDYECHKYGVYETPERLAKKAELWKKYADYKTEWVRRFNYYAWGIRPGEESSFFSPCWWAPAAVRYNVKTDYQPRKNPMFLTPVRLVEQRVQKPFFNYIPRVSQKGPIFEARPELKYLHKIPSTGVQASLKAGDVM